MKLWMRVYLKAEIFIVLPTRTCFFFHHFFFKFFVSIRFTHKLDPVAHTITIMISCLVVFFFSASFQLLHFCDESTTQHSPLQIRMIQLCKPQKLCRPWILYSYKVIMILIIVASHLFGICLANIGNGRAFVLETYKQKQEQTKQNQPSIKDMKSQTV